MKFIRKIDQGGFGVVDEVELSDGTRVARKTFNPRTGTDEERSKLRRRFEREVRIQSQISHPNVMPILDSDLASDPPWFTMPLASQSFAQKIKDDRAAGVVDKQPWVDILAGVEELHRLGYVHRDLKPQNVLYIPDRWVVSDFGLVLPTMRDTTMLTGPASAYGSRSYAAPEQAADFRHTPEEADIYAIACIIHDLVDTYPARVPFAQVRASGPYGALIEKGTEVDPTRRFRTVAALRAALFDVWQGEETESISPDTKSVLDALLEQSDVLSNWENFIRYLESDDCDARERDRALRAVNEDMIVRLYEMDAIWFGRLVVLLCRWAKNSAFDWDYCDVVGDRLVRAFDLSTTRLRVAIVDAIFELAVYHNRWKVMGQGGRMLDTDADPGLVARIVIELRSDHALRLRFFRIEEVIGWARGSWHRRIGEVLGEFE